MKPLALLDRVEGTPAWIRYGCSECGWHLISCMEYPDRAHRPPTEYVLSHQPDGSHVGKILKPSGG